MKISRKILFLFFTALLLVPVEATAQQPERSDVIEQIGDKVFYIHLVQPGETITSIAKVYGVSTSEIYDLTPGLEPEDPVKANQILRVPLKEDEPEPGRQDSKNVAPVTPSGELNQQKEDSVKEQDLAAGKPEKKKKRFEYHRVRPKETLYSLSKQYNVSMDAIRSVNPGLEKEIKVDQTLMIPVYKAGEESVAEADEKADKVVDEQENIFKGKLFSYYTVKPKETIYRISKNFGVSQEELLSMNPAVEEEGLKAGQKIRIPHEAKEEDAGGGDEKQNAPATGPVAGDDQDSIQTVRRYKVGFLERVPGIAKRQDVEIERIYELNPGVKKEGVRWGDVIKLPRKAAIQETDVTDEPEEKEESAVNYITHEVMKKETLYRISKLYDVPQEDIIALNPGSDRGIKKGEILRIPVSTPAAAEEEITEEVEEEDDSGIMKEEMEVRCAERSGEQHRYRVALMIPFYLDDYQPIDTAMLENEIALPPSMNFIQFYEGAMLAVDTLKKQGLKADVYVYDVGKSRADAEQHFDSELERMDLIIGPIYNDAFSAVLDFAQRNDIKVVNPLSSRKEIITGNKDVFKVQTPVESELEAMAGYIRQYYTDSVSIFLVRNNRYQHEEKVKYLRESLSEKGIGLTDKNRIYEVDYSKDSLHPVLDSTKWKNRNIVIALSDREVFTIELVRHLNEMHDSIPEVTLFGMSDWRKFDLETEYLLNLNVHLFDNTYTDYAASDVEWFVSMFRKKYATEPVHKRYAFDGYDITYYFLSALYRYGSDFTDCIKYHRPDLLYMGMRFIENDTGSFENRSAFPLRYYNYRLLKMRGIKLPEQRKEARRSRF